MKIPGINHKPMFWFKDEPAVLDGMLLPAQAVLVDSGVRQPPVVLAQSGQRDPAAAAERAASERAAAAQIFIEHWAAVAFAHSAEAHALVASQVQAVTDQVNRKVESFSPPQDPQLLSKDLPPLPVSGKLEPEDLHQG